MPADTTDPGAVEVGVKFQSSLNGSITGIRFYKGTTNTGTHVGNLWTSTGTLLATATFTNETASGWQQATFATPVAISANTTYVASYHTNVGNYAYDLNYFASTGVTNGPLTALASGMAGGNGVYRYGTTSGFPTQTWNSSNYWVDVVYSPVANTTPPTVTITAPTSAPTYSTRSSSVSLGGTAADSVRVTQVTWTNNRGGSGTASGTTSWTVNGIPLQYGTNVIRVTARDASGNTQTTTLTVTRSWGR